MKLKKLKFGCLCFCKKLFMIRLVDVLIKVIVLFKIVVYESGISNWEVGWYWFCLIGLIRFVIIVVLFKSVDDKKVSENKC